MVKKYFRPFICSVCTALSVILGFGNAAALYAASEAGAETEAASGMAAGTADEADPSEGEGETEAPDGAEPSTEGQGDGSEDTDPPGETSPTEPGGDTSGGGGSSETPGTGTDTPETGESGEGSTEAPGNGDAGTTAPTPGDGSQTPEPGTEDTQETEQPTEPVPPESEPETDAGDEDDEGEWTPTPQFTLDKDEYGIGSEILATFEGASDPESTKLVAEIEVPEGTVFRGIKERPEFSGADVTIEYRDTESADAADVDDEGDDSETGDEQDGWKAYPAQDKEENGDLIASLRETKAIRITASLKEDGAKGLQQTKPLVLQFMPTEEGQVTFEAACEFTRNGDVEAVAVSYDAEISKEEPGTNEGDLSDAQADISITQETELPLPGSEARQKVDLTYFAEVDNMVTFTPGTGMDVKRIEFGEGSYFAGGRATVSSSTGDTTIGIDSPVLDLTAYAGIKKVSLYPASKASAGLTASFTVVFTVANDARAFTSGASVTTGPQDDPITVTAAYSSNVGYLNLLKPSVSFGDKIVKFGDSFGLPFGNIGMDAISVAGPLTYELRLPAFLTVNSVTLPVFNGASSVRVFADINGVETLLGEFKGGEEIKLSKGGVSLLKLEIAHTDGRIQTSREGLVSATNNNEGNRTNYFGFRATTRASVPGGQEQAAVSDILGVTFEVYKKTTDEPLPPVTNDPQGPGQTAPGTSTPTVPGNQGSPETEETEETEPDTESSYDKIKEEEEKKKQEILDKALENEETLKEKQKQLLADRISSIRGAALQSSGGTSVSGSETGTSGAAGETGADSAKEDPYKDWKVKPVREGIVESVVPGPLLPISERIVEDIRPSQMTTP